MSDERYRAPGGSAPPPQAPPHPPYAAAASRPTPWGWIVAAILAVALIVLICLYFFTDVLSRPASNSLDNRGSSPSQSGAGSMVSSGGSTMGQGSFPSPTTAPPATQFSSVPTAAGLVGTWSDSCPDSRDSLTLTADGGYTMPEGAGTWTLDGSTVTLSGDGEPIVTRWEMVSPTVARVTVVATGEIEIARRCS